jgi:phosphate:Na+ symporter
VFNILGVLIWLPFIGFLAQMSVSVSPSYPELDGAAQMAKEVPRQIANAHTIFNVANTVIFIWFTGALARLVQRLVPDREGPSLEIIKPKFINEGLLSTPTLALEAARMETHRLGDIAFSMVEKLGPALQTGDMRQLDELEKMDDQVDVLQEHILNYLGETHKQELTEKQVQGLLLMLKGLDEIDRIADTVRNDLIPLGRSAHEQGFEATDTTQHILTTLYDRICHAVRQATAAIADVDQNKALEVVNMKAQIDSLINESLQYQADRVAPTTPDLISTFRMEDDVIDALRRIYRLSRRLAKLMLPAVVSSKET